jgi:hypothetical protein
LAFVPVPELAGPDEQPAARSEIAVAATTANPSLLERFIAILLSYFGTLGYWAAR